MRFYLIRHAHTQPIERLPPHEWPLSEAGRRQANALAALPLWPQVRRIYSSPEAKTMDTIRPAAERHGIPIVTEPDLRELERPAGLIPDYAGAVAACFAAPRKSHRGWETAAHAQARILAAIHRIGKAAEGDAVALASHGLLCALLLAGLAERQVPTLAEWRAIPTPGWALLELTDPETPRPFARVVTGFRPI